MKMKPPSGPKKQTQTKPIQTPIKACKVLESLSCIRYDYQEVCHPTA